MSQKVTNALLNFALSATPKRKPAATVRSQGSKPTEDATKTGHKRKRRSHAPRQTVADPNFTVVDQYQNEKKSQERVFKRNLTYFKAKTALSRSTKKLRKQLIERL
ncbi:hypothetical protein IWQ62_001966 [Dispira parvispora]|uniref:Uncharacterized protein n=1 Tax=Dispira parvispora TaxID=1520584 RepID=A0A9W8E800_9FUNG|nr:hypothetical protein IWQ62_001966 [Dispira parvispora]